MVLRFTLFQTKKIKSSTFENADKKFSRSDHQTNIRARRITIKKNVYGKIHDHG